MYYLISCDKLQFCKMINMSWCVENNYLCKEFAFKNFVGTVEFVNKIVPLAEAMVHHPDILIHSYKRVRVMLRTHSQDKITDRDHALSKQIDGLLDK